MIQPRELKKSYPVRLSDDVLSTTDKVWLMLDASRRGDKAAIEKLVRECPALAFAQYNYTPPIHFAAREGHRDVLTYLLQLGAHDPSYEIYPFRESLEVLAADRGLTEIVDLLQAYRANPLRQKFKGDNGEILYNRTGAEQEFEQAVDAGDLLRTKQILEQHPQFALDESFFWSEGILLFAVKKAHYEMIDLLLSYGAKVPKILKWTQFYYFERLDAATYIMEKAMDPNTMSWQQVTILHDMAQKGFVSKAELLLKFGADIDPIDEEYRSTPLGMASRWGQLEMVEFLLKQGADPNRSGATWSTPLAWARKKGHDEIAGLLLGAGATR